MTKHSLSFLFGYLRQPDQKMVELANYISKDAFLKLVRAYRDLPRNRVITFAMIQEDKRRYNQILDELTKDEYTKFEYFCHILIEVREE